MKPHDLLRRYPEPRGDRFQLEAVLPAVATRQLDRARRRQDIRPGLGGERTQRDTELLRPDDQGIVVDEERAEAGNGLDDSGERLLPNEVFESKNARVHLAADFVAQLHGERPITAGQQARLRVDRHGPFAAICDANRARISPGRSEYGGMDSPGSKATSRMTSAGAAAATASR